MTQEDKKLLLIDLCARLPYGIKVKSIPIEGYSEGFIGEVAFCSIKREQFGLLTEYGELVVNLSCDIVKPYLRPLSSMTEEEKKDILQSLNIHGNIDNEGNLLLGVECNIITLKICKKYLGELNKRMFDICHMIEKGLALEAPEGMYEKK